MTPIDPAREIYEIPDAMLAEFGLTRGAVPAATYHCEELGVVSVPLNELRVPGGRAVDPTRLRRVLSAIVAHEPLPALPVYREPTAVVVLDGMHRYPAARALGLRALPCRELSLDDARDFYCYPEGQR
jgi:hypothetical protein